MTTIVASSVDMKIPIPMALTRIPTLTVGSDETPSFDSVSEELKLNHNCF